MKLTKLFVGAFALTAMLVACDSDSASAKDTEIEELSSSSAIEIASSSSTIRNDSLSSSAMETSSSSAIESSSSSVVEIASSSSTTRNDNSSSSSETTQSSSSSENISAGSVYDATAKTLTDLRDGQTYKTVTIGTQTWMAENLNYAYTGVPYNYSGYTSDSTSWCYDNDPANCAKYGRLYTWAAAIDSVKLATDADNPLDCGYGKTCTLSGKVQGVCPEDWHLPSYEEWNTLLTAVGGLSTAGKVLKSQTGWKSQTGLDDDSGNGTDAFGFSALPAGIRYRKGDYLNERDDAFFWSSTERESNYAYSMYLCSDCDLAYLNGYLTKYLGLSVRCVKD